MDEPLNLFTAAKQNISSLQSAIAELCETQKQLRDNCNKAKGDVHTAVTRQLEALRNREVFLLNQVDTLHHVKEERLQKQIIGLVRELGSLEEKMTMIQQCSEDVDLIQELERTLERFEDLKLTPSENPDVTFHAKTDKLRRKIHSFGAIDGIKRRCLESVFERQYVTGTVQECCFMDMSELFTPFHDPIILPQWLLPQATPQTSFNKGTDPLFLPFNMEKAPSDWLLLPSDSADNFEMMEELSDGDTVEPLETNVNSGRCDGAGADEIVAHMQAILTSANTHWLLQGTSRHDHVGPHDHVVSEVAFEYFRQVSEDIRDWLVGCERRDEEFEQKMREAEPCINPCACVQSGDHPQEIEIENLAELLCMQIPPIEKPQSSGSDNDKWLLPQSDLDQAPSISSVCRANETCSSFSQCVCDNNCAVDYQSSHSGIKNEKWLFERCEESRVESDSTFEYFCQVSKEHSDWLYDSSAMDDSVSTEIDPEDSVWLFPKSCLLPEVEDAEEDKCFEEQDMKDGENNPGESIFCVVEKYHSQFAPSDWLRNTSPSQLEEMYDSECTVAEDEESVSLSKDAGDDVWLLKSEKQMKDEAWLLPRSEMADLTEKGQEDIFPYWALKKNKKLKKLMKLVRSYPTSSDVKPTFSVFSEENNQDMWLVS